MIRTSIQDGIGSIVLARPDRRNALTPEMLDAIAAAATTPGSDCDVLLVRGEGPSFCAGFDLDLCRDDQEGDALRRLLEGLWRAVRSLRDQPRPVVMAVHGAAIAGGCALLGGADIVIAERATKLGYPVARLGISPGVSSPFLSNQLPGGAVRELQLDPGLVTSQRALELGLVSEVVDGEEVTLARAVQIAAQLRSKPQEAIRETRRWLQSLAASGDHAERLGLRTSLDLVGGEELNRMLPRAWAGRGG